MGDDHNTRLVRKTYTPPPPPQAAATMTPQDSEAWNSWANGLIAARLNEFADTIGSECGLIEGRIQKQITALEKQIVDLRIENAFERGKNAGVILDLPALPSRKSLHA
jgi:hypothetical protein